MPHFPLRVAAGAVLLLSTLACPVPGTAVQDGGTTATSSSSRVGGSSSARAPSSALPDAGVADAAFIPDAAVTDAATPVDAAQPVDAAVVVDAAVPADAGSPDAAGDVDDSVVDSATLPSALACSASFAVTVTMRNTGTTTWSKAGGYKLGAVGDSDPFWGPEPRVWLPDAVTIGPGGTHVFSMAMNAPATPTSVVTDWRMVHEGVRWFGATAQQGVSVSCAAPVDASTLTGKLVMGYQGWFACPGDGSPVDGWVHWFGGSAQPTVDLWPDTSELAPGELCTSGYTRPDGTAAPLYSAWNTATVVRHFQWMADNHLDGVFLQRFISELGDARFLALRDRVTSNVKQGAETHGRVFAIEYDISGATAATLVDTIKNDWIHLVDGLGLTQSSRYLRHRGKPVVTLWGFGFTDRPGTVAQAQELVTWFHSGAPVAYQATLVAGVPRDWRVDATWAPVFRTFDVIHPWTVGAFVDNAGADNYRTTMAADIADATAHGADFLPVIFPGFSWKNLNAGPLNQIPRRAGNFYWRQVYNAVGAGAPMIFGAMFDEVDEGTAMYKMVPTAAGLPTQATFLSLDADGTAMGSDFYLRLADQAGRMLRGELALTPTRPISPP